jgi:hypothetical protein
VADGRYIRVAPTWHATIGTSTPYPTAFYAALVGQTLRFGMPAARRGGRGLAVIARLGIPESALGASLRAVGRVRARRDPVVDGYLQAARDAWPLLVREDATLRPVVDLDVLVLRRASATTVFLFTDSSSPALVCKLPLGDSAPIQRETEALQLAAPLGVAPRSFGEVAGLGHVQRGLVGRALHIEPVTPSSAARLSWTPQHESLARAFERLSLGTAVEGAATWWSDGVVQRAASHPSMSAATRATVMTAAERLQKHSVGVLCHIDTSPQNLLFDRDRLTGLIDWEFATMTGLPGRDMLNAACATIENGVALVRWNERTVVESFLVAWLRSSFAARARDAAGACAAAAGIPAALHDAAEVVYFARRLGHRMVRPKEHLTSTHVALSVLEAVCARHGHGVVR